MDLRSANLQIFGRKPPAAYLPSPASRCIRRIIREVRALQTLLLGTNAASAPPPIRLLQRQEFENGV
jgi:hypothetical protein